MSHLLSSSGFTSRLKKAVERQTNMALLPNSFRQDTEKAAKCMSCPSMGIVVGIAINLQYVMSYSFINIENTDWLEPLLTWPFIFMPSGTRKSSIHKFTVEMLNKVEQEVNKDLHMKDKKSFTVQECTIEKLGRLLQENDGKKVWFFDEGDILFKQLGVYSIDRHITTEESVLLKMYNGCPWKHDTVTRSSFDLKRTNLIVGGLTQSKKAMQILQEDKIESGLLPRFIFMCLHPVFEELDTMKPINNDYRIRIHNMLLEALRSHNDKNENMYILIRKTPAYIKFRKFYTENKTEMEKTWNNQDHDLINAFKRKLPGKILRLSATFTCLFNLYSEQCKTEMLDYEVEQEINLREELESISMPETDSQEQVNEATENRAICCMAMDFAIEMVQTSYYQTMELLGVEPSIRQNNKSLIGKLLVFGGKVLHITVLYETLYLGKGVGRHDIENLFTEMQSKELGHKTYATSQQQGNRQTILFEIDQNILQKIEKNENLQKSLYDHGVSYSELEKAFEKPNRVPRKRHLVEINDSPGGTENTERNKQEMQYVDTAEIPTCRTRTSSYDTSPPISNKESKISDRMEVGPQTQPQAYHSFQPFVTDIEKLKRFLCFGTELGYYKANSQHRKFSRSEVQAIDRLIQLRQGYHVVECIKLISVQGKSYTQNPALYALAVCARSNDETTKHNAYRVLNDVCRIPTHLFQFIKYCEEMSGYETGWGRAHRKAISQWYTQFGEANGNRHKNPLELAYLVTKFRSRCKWSHKDVIRLAHVRSRNKAIRITLQYALGKNGEVADSTKSSEVMNFLVAVQKAKRCIPEKDEDELCEYIANHQLSWEHIPNWFLKNSIKVWDVLFHSMPLTAMIRYLGKMTSLGMQDGKPWTDFWVQHVVNRLDDDIQLTHARIHPLTLLIAMKYYEQGTHRNKKMLWSPDHRITEALGNAFIKITRLTQPQGKKFLMAISVGENMQKRICGSTISAGEAAAAMVYSIIQTEDVEVILFTNNIADASTTTIKREDGLQSITEKIYEIPHITQSKYHKHVLSVPFKWVADRKKKFDSIMVFTDSIASCGFIHPAEALKQYTQYMTIPDYRFVVVAMTSDKYSVAAPDSVHNLDVVGFDTLTPSIIMEFVENSQHKHVESRDIFLHADEDLFIYLH